MRLNSLASRSRSCFVISCLLLLLFLFVCVNRVGCSPSSSSSCGSLHNISSPFRLTSDRSQDGSRGYEILCDGGKPMLELGSSAQYYVTSISYTNQTISVVDPVFVDGVRDCPFPIQSPPPDFSNLYSTVGEYWALFVNCTTTVRDDNYRPVPCLSGNDTFIYVVVQTYALSVELIKASCGFLASIPVGDAENSTAAADVFELLKKGFMLSWDVGPPPPPQPTQSAMFHGCLKEAKRSAMPRLAAILSALFLVAAVGNTIVSGDAADDGDFFKTCPASRCSEGGPEIRFPFRLDSGPSICGAPGMELSCSGNNDTVLALPHAGSFNVTAVDYLYGEVTIDLGCSCLRCLTESQLASVNLTTSAYQPMDRSFVSLLGCPRKWTPDANSDIAGPISCFGSLSQFVYVVSFNDYAVSLPSDCRVIADGLSISFRRMVRSSSAEWPTLKERVADLLARGEVTIGWFVPQITGECMLCEKAKKRCGFSSTTNQVFCQHGRNIKLIAATSSAAFVVLLSLVVMLVYFLRRSKREKEIRLRVEKFLASYNAIKPTRYTFSELKKITKRFKNKLGQGGFGSVYKGELANGIPVAVKMLQRSKWDGREFTNEVATIGRIHHFNVVRLLGFCSEGTTHALIYEFMPNESLEKYIFSRSRNTPHEPLTMEKLLEIAVGIARGIEYLHQGCNQRILHFDIKPHNILLDRNFNPKISDFGLAKLCSRDQSIVTMTAARGTMGYIAPEMYSRNFGAVSYKADVYSFGMLVLEMVGGRRNADHQIESQSEFYFPEWIYDQLANGQDIGPAIEIANTSEIEIAKKLAVVGLWCIQWDPRDRPSMTRVVQMLIGDSENLQMPPTPFVSSSGQGVVVTAPNEA